MSSLRTWVSAFVVGALVLLLTVTAVPAGAEPPVDVVDGAVDGVYIAPGRDFDAAELATVVADARTRGIDLLIAAPADPEPDASAYALRLRQLGEFDAAIVFGVDGEIKGSVTDDYFDGFARAEKAAAAAASPGPAASAFVGQLLQGPPGGLPDVVKDVIRYVMILLLIIGVVTAAEMVLRSRRRTRSTTTEHTV